MPLPHQKCPLVLAWIVGFLIAGGVSAQDKKPGADLDLAIDRGLAYLLAIQEPDGSWRGPQPEHYHGMTSLAVYTLLKCGLPTDHPAVRAGIAHVRGQPCTRTYDLGCRLMMLEAMGEPRDPAEVKALADRILKTIGNGKKSSGARWGYPGDHGGNGYGHTDLSNTQYAILGLRAARKCGYPAGEATFWKYVAEHTYKGQANYGGHGYHPGSTPTSSMTVAGATVVSVCADALGESADLSLKGAMRASVASAMRWLDQNWTVETVKTVGDKVTEDDHWVYYYLYGLERLAAFEGVDLIGKHDWYQEGVAHILKRQGDKGSWGEGDSDTCFALLFLRRASRGSGLGPRTRLEADLGKTAALVVGMDGENPVNAWVRAAGEVLKTHFDEGAIPTELVWKINGAEATRRKLKDKGSLFDPECTLRHLMTQNGKHHLVAEIELVRPDGSYLTVASNVLDLTVDNVEEPWHREAIADASKNLLEEDLVKASSSSERDRGTAAQHAVDRHFSKSWVTAKDDKDPWLLLELDPSVKASVLKVTSADAYGIDKRWYARPRDLEIKINNDAPFSARLEDTAQRKQSIPLGQKSIRTLRIRIRSAYGGSREPTSTGFKEVQLYAQEHAAPEDALKIGSSIELITLPARDEATEWKYVDETPAPGWESPGFRENGWKTGKSGFGTVESTYTPSRTPWKTPEIWVRREFLLDRPEKGELRVEMYHDDGAEVYLNGVLAVTAPTFSQSGYVSYPISDEAKAARQPGRNLIPIHCTNTGGAAYLDAHLVRRLTK